LKDRKVAVDASCACKKKGHKGSYVEKDNSHCLHKWLELWSTHNA